MNTTLPLKRISLSFLIIVLLAFGGAGLDVNAMADTHPLAPPVFLSETAQDTASGHVQLEWGTEEAASETLLFELQRSETPTFANPVTLYQGPDTGTFLSGLSDGDYYFRLRAQTVEGNARSAWSSPLRVTVQHHAMALAMGLFALGGVVFLSTVTVLIQGDRAMRSAES
jgi:hypothetical protein